MGTDGKADALRTLQTEEELRDLHEDDAQELRDFLEKRRWFESKLKILEDVPPIYPFVHPRFAAGIEKSSDTRAHTERWPLPSVDQVKQWQTERDQIEEEVLEFDGGDLERIKRKTRTATQLPLTARSTHLVSVTLDLIVLVDRLLKLLRHRGEVLQLTKLRLEWDRLRWEIVSETRKIREEVDSIVKDKGRWTPAAADKTWTSSSPKLDVSSTTTPHTPPRPNPSSVPSIASSLNSIHLSPDLRPDSPGQSPSRSHSTPKRSLHVPLLHSQLVNVQIRHQTLSSTRVSRSGAILDRMIDIACPLKGLGDVNGPSDETQDGGAVPDELLDVQDEMEEEVRQLGDKVMWCKELEDHWKRSEAYHASSSQALSAADQVLSDLQSALDKPATSERHQRLAEMLERAEKCLPTRLDDTSFPNPTHPDYPEVDVHNGEVVMVLKAEHDIAMQAVDKGRRGIEWYRKLVIAREEMYVKRHDILNESTALKQTLHLIANGTVEVKRPDPLNEEDVIGSLPWSEMMKEWMEDATAQIDVARSVTRSSMLACQRYRNASRLPIVIQDGYSAYQDESIAMVGDEADKLLRMTQSVTKGVEEALQHREMLKIIRPMLLAALSILTTQERSFDSLINAVGQSPWPEDHTSSNADYAEVLRQLEQRINAEVTLPDATLRSRFATHDHNRSINHQSFDTVLKVVAFQKDLQRTYELLKRLRGQASAVKIINEEAENFILNISTLRTSVGVGPLETLEKDVEAWRADLATRVPLLSDEVSRGAARLQEPSAASDHLVDLGKIDQRTRNAVNERTMQVAAAMVELTLREADTRWDSWTQRCHRSAERVDQVLCDWQEYRTNLEKQRAKAPDGSPRVDLLLAIRKHTAQMENAATAMQDEVAQIPESSLHRWEKEVTMWRTAVVTARRVIDGAIEEAKTTERMLNQQQQRGPADVFSSTAVPETVEVLQDSTERTDINRMSNGVLHDQDNNIVPDQDIIRPSSVVSMSRLPRLSGSLPQATSRSASNPKAVAGSPTLTRSLSRNRAVSETPARTRLHSLGSSAIPRLSSTYRKPNVATQAQDRSTTLKSKKGYVADPQNRLDVAVGKIVNKLEVGVPVRPVGVIGDNWQDESGQYWIGAEGRARLCFCRILRSRTVMVRVGGGWVELSRFLLDHFADAVVETVTGSETVPLSQSNSSLASILSDVPSTPPRLVKSASSHSLDASPMAAFQFMRKASESPSIREKEKELFHGRRSILGRE
ncbi:hypothetical protein IAU59_006682 [Kwoniella sp. CBS 9459]